MSIASPPEPVKQNKSEERRTPVNASTLAEHGRDHCVIDMHNLFVGTTLEDELLLLGAGEGAFADIGRECALFGVRIEPARTLSSYSGGEQAIICCLTLMALLPRRPLRILLVHILETLSPRNREMLLDRFATVLPEATILTLVGNEPKPAGRHA
ncbi:hypothetical protein DSECCO2_321810 [anaerobic digester metagenome]